LLDIADDFAAPGFAEIDIEVGHRHAVGVEEAFEQQAMFQRIEIGDGQRPGDHRAGARAAPRPDRNALRLRPADEVGHDQEIAGKAHGVDDAKLERQPVVIGPAASPVMPRFSSRAREAGFGGGDKGRVFAAPSVAMRGRIGLRAGAATAQRCATTSGVGDGFGQVGKRLAHRVGGFQPVLRVGLAAVLGLDIG
jgi:hypothetical protein